MAFRVGRETARGVILETCDAIKIVLEPLVLKMPSQEEWLKISKDFERLWDLPNCIGAVDGKHIAMQAAPNSGSLFYNYKHYHSLVLMAVCDAKYKFTMVNSGALGSESDGGIFERTDFGAKLINGTFPLPNSTLLPNSDVYFPHFFVGDEAFSLKSWFMRPYPGNNLSYEQQIFNYRLSRARRVIENAFGILVSRWRVLRKPLLAWPDSIDRITMACVCLHNFLMMPQESESIVREHRCPDNYVEDHEFNVIEENAHTLRDNLAAYLAGPGEVDWQENHVHRGCAPDSG